MQLKTIHVRNFRSVENSEEFKVGQVTCLVGKNEAGKSAILLALAALNPHPATPAIFDKERDYPRRSLTQYAQRHAEAEAIAIDTVWEITDVEMAKIASSVGEGVVASPLVRIVRRYGKDIEVTANLDFPKALELLYSRFALDSSERADLSTAKTTSELIGLLSKLASPTSKHQQLQAYLGEHGAVTPQVSALILSMLPKFMYFSAYDRMEGAVQLEQTQQLIGNGQIGSDDKRGVKLFVDSSITRVSR